MELYVIRHGTTDWNADNRFQGAKDIPLNKNGQDLARELGKRLDPIHFDRVYSSPLCRAYETAQLAIASRSLKIETDQRLIELSFGELEGTPFTEWMNTTEPRKYFFDAPEKYIPPKGGETFESARTRTKDFIQNVIEPIYKQNPESRIMLVAHGALIAALTSYLENRPLSQYWGRGLKGNCQEAVYTYDGKNWNITEDSKPMENPYKKSVEK